MIRKAKLTDLNKITELYELVLNDLEDKINYPGWKKGVYPTIDDARIGISREEMYLAFDNEKIIGTVIFNHLQEDAYKNASWSCEAKENEVYVVHTLAINPHYQGRQVARKLLEFGECLAKEQGIKTMRLDVRCGNHPAIKLYRQCGYCYVGKINLDYRSKDIGMFELYEKVLAL